WWLRASGLATPAMVDAKTIAVLPFQNMSDDKDTTYFADGMHEDLLTQLAMLGQLKVVSRTSVMEYRNTAKKVPQIGSELKVASLVEGSVRRSGNMVRVTAQLVDAQSDKHVWAANYDRDLRDIFKVQSELATEIARSLNVSLSATEEKSLARAPTANLEAYDLFLKHQDLVRNGAGTLRSTFGLTERIALLERAVALDSEFAIAWAVLAGEYARVKGYGFNRSAQQKALAQKALLRAQQLAPDDLQVMTQKGAVHLHALDDHQGAMAAYQAVLARAPYNVAALSDLSIVYTELGRYADAAQALERALAVDVRHAGSLSRLVSVYGRHRQFDKALGLQQQLMALRPGETDLRAMYEYWSYLKTGSWQAYDAWRATLPTGVEKRYARVRNNDADRAIAAGNFAEVHRLADVDSEDGRAPLNHSAQANMAYSHVLLWHAAGDVEQVRTGAAAALRTLDAALKETPEDSTWWEFKAKVYAVLGRRAEALSAFDLAVERAKPSGNLFELDRLRRRRVDVLALLGDHDEALAMLKRFVKLPGFYINEARTSLPLASLWKHPGFIALVNDPASNAPLPLGTPVFDNTQR
ncbi:MAG: tetratricopeptide repeat protein, partial [Ramlibacter sp.]